MHKSSNSRRAAAGFTLLEVIFTIVLLGVMTKFAMMKLVTPAALTLPAQAQSVADVIRRAQTLAVVRGQRVRVSVAASGPDFLVQVAPCNSAGTCTIDSSLTLLADRGVMWCTTPTVYFNSLGEPVTSAAPAASAATSPTPFPMAYRASCPATAALTVTVVPLTGRVSVGP